MTLIRIGGAVAAGGWTVGTPQTPSGAAAVDFTGLPAGLNAIDLLISNMTLSGSDQTLIQIGDSGGVETTGYEANGAVTNVDITSTAGFIIYTASSAYDIHGFVSIRRVTGNLWVCSYSLGNYAGSEFHVGGGSKTLSDTLDRIRIDTTGTNTISASSVNILYQ